MNKLHHETMRLVKFLENYYDPWHMHISTKFKAFTWKIPTLLKDLSSNNEDNIYIKSIISFREGKDEEAIKLIDKLLLNNSKNPYLFELKGQIFFAAGKLKEAIIFYKKALDISYHSALIKLQYAICIVQYASLINDEMLLKQARILLEEVQLHESENILLYHYLAIVYGKLGLFVDANLASAEKFFILGDNKKSKFFAKKALINKNKLSSSAKIIKIHDLINLLDLEK